MYLTDEQIMLLEQLTYLTDDVADAAGVLLGPYDSVENLLQQFDDDALQRLEDPGNPDSTKDYTGGKKWAAIIRQIKSDPDLYSLDIVNKDDSVPAICFNDPDDPEHAVVVFRGTSGKDEWIDNAIGLGVSDTERQKAALDYIENGQWLKSIRFKLPIIENDLSIGLDNGNQVDTVVLLSKLNAKQHIEVELNLDELDLTAAESKATYDEIKAYVLEKYGLKVSSLYISQVKRKCGLDVGQNYNLSKKEDAKVPQCPPDKEAAIMEALKHFHMV